MKKNLQLFKALVIFLVFSFTHKTNAQCSLVANFSVNQLGNGNVQFVSTSTGTTTQSYYQWSSNPSNLSSNASSAIANFINGTYTITLSVVNNFTPSLCSHTVSQVITVTSNTCNLVPSFVQTVSANSASFASTSAGTVVGSTYTWHYGDATQGSGNPTSHTYANTPNVYNCYLVVNNGGGCIDSVFNPVTINVPCNLNASFVANQLGNGNVQFVSTSTGTTSQTFYQWSSNISYIGSTNPVTANFINGTYTITFSALNTFTPSTCSQTVSQVITVTSNTCNLVPSFVQTVVANNATLQSTSTGTVVGSTYSWHYGDATQGTGNPSTHTYPNAPGGYVCYLVVNNGAGCIDSVSNVVTINVPCNINASFVANQLGNGNVQFVSTSTGTVPNTSYQWYKNFTYFGSSNPITTNFANGTHTITFAVVNSFTPSACSQTITQIITVTSNTCNLNAAFNFTQGANGLVNFASTSTGTIPGMTYVWDFGDGFNTIGGPTASHSYTNAGIHQAALVVQDPNNPICKDSVTIPINITSVPCVANSNFTLTQLSPGNWQAIPQYPYNVNLATWSWGDNTFDNFLYASHTYSPIGLYTICLTVSVSCGATSTTCASYNITRLSSPMSMAFVNVVPPQAQTITGFHSNGFLAANETIIYPNPSNGSFEIMIKGLNETIAVIDIYSLTGKLIQSSQTEISNGQLYKQIALKDQANGIYFVKIKTNEGLITKKIVLQN